MPDHDFYLGRHYIPANKKTTDKPFMYDPADLTTHAVVTGMTGSGKTGLCVAILEEAALNGIPALIIDPKGDLSNLLLHFPDLAPQDFQPWIDPELARRAGITLDQVAQKSSAVWREGLSRWGMGEDRLLALKNSAQYAIYTPGSDSGLLIRVLSSLAMPEAGEIASGEILIDKISSTVTALLNLVGIKNVDPLRSREHILLAKIVENTWKQNKDIQLEELILQIQNPPFDELGAFSIETFFPQKERMELAVQLNNILVSPSFQAWREGHDLDIQSLLFMPDGKPRHSVFYLAHLSESERMFFVTLLLSQVESWMRKQTGVPNLRAILYMDELFGYLPPQKNPPSKQPLLRLLKQARAYGLGLLLATQNPVDLDYKALSNAGTWFIGKLQTERDKDRLLDGLESAAGDVSRSTIDKLISSLDKRVFIQHNVHEKQPAVFKTRWVLNFLAGPLTRSQLPQLNGLVGADQISVQYSNKVSASEVEKETQGVSETGLSPAASKHPDHTSTSSEVKNASTQLGSVTRPAVPANIEEYFLPTNLSLTESIRTAGKKLPDAILKGVLYRPTLLAVAMVRFLNRTYDIDINLQYAALIIDPNKRGMVAWEEHIKKSFPVDLIEHEQAPQAQFETLNVPLNNSKQMSVLKRDFIDWLYHSVTVELKENKALKVYGGPDDSQAEFMKACAQAAREAAEAEIDKKSAQIDQKIKSLEDKIDREERELDEDEAELSHRKWEEAGTHLENIFGINTRYRRRISTSLRQRRLTEQAKADVQESESALATYERQLEKLYTEREQAIKEIIDHWGNIVNDETKLTLTPKKKDIYIELFGVAWMPYYVVESGEKLFELLSYSPE